MQTNDDAENVKSCAIPASFRDGYFIAIRSVETKSISRQSSCIFNCWIDAQMHLKQMKIEGRNVEYEAFETLDAATHYAFQKKASTLVVGDQLPSKYEFYG